MKHEWNVDCHSYSLLSGVRRVFANYISETQPDTLLNVVSVRSQLAEGGGVLLPPNPLIAVHSHEEQQRM